MNPTAEKQAYFLTGTDTEVGKTFVACTLLHAWRAQGLRALAYKPIAAGAELHEGEWSNEDARRLHAACSAPVTLAEINPVCLREAIAPHIAATRENRHFDLGQIVQGFERLSARADRLVVEGAGGFLVPLDEGRDMGALACALQLPVLLVVGLRLGCLNHALLTAEAIRARGLTLAGWIGNLIDPEMRCCAENVDTLRARLEAPCLGVLPRLTDPRDGAPLIALPE